MSHPTDFTPVPVPPKDDAPKAVMMELTVRIMHPGELWTVPLEKFLGGVAHGAAAVTAACCGAKPTQRITVEVIPVRKGIEPVLVSATAREFLQMAQD